MGAADELSERRNRRTLAGVVCGLTAGDGLEQGDIDEIARFKSFLEATAHLPAPGQAQTQEQASERDRIYESHYPASGLGGVP